MDFDSKAERILQWKRGETPGPWRMFVFPTYVCNLRCGYCGLSHVPDPPELHNNLSDERLLRLVDEGAELDVRNWYIGGGGEPMVRHKVVMEMLKKIRAAGMNGTLQSNGTLFKPHQLETFVEIGWDELSISIDGPTAEVNDDIRHEKSFGKLTKAIRELNELKKKANTEFPRVMVSCVVSAKNAHLLAELIDLFSDLGVYAVTFNEVFVQFPGLDDFVLSDEQRAAIQESSESLVAKAESLALGTNVAEFAAGLGNVEIRELPPVKAYQPEVSEVDESNCYDPWLSLSVMSSGNIVPCCVFWEPETDSLHDMTLKEAWYGPYMTQFRQQMLIGSPPKPCEECQGDFIRHNEALREVVDAAVEREGMDWSLSPGNLASKAVSSLQRHGIAGSVRRGKEWLQLRGTAKQG